MIFELQTKKDQAIQSSYSIRLFNQAIQSGYSIRLFNQVNSSGSYFKLSAQDFCSRFLLKLKG